jgi:hypothetical protein
LDSRVEYVHGDAMGLVAATAGGLTALCHARALRVRHRRRDADD